MSGLEVNGIGLEPSAPIVTFPLVTSRPRNLHFLLNKWKERKTKLTGSRRPKVICESSSVEEGIRNANGLQLFLNLGLCAQEPLCFAFR